MDKRAAELFGDYSAEKLARFKEWHELNPHVFRRFKVIAFRIKATGRTAYSAYTVFYAMRFEFDLETRGDVFKINNNFLPLYVRLLVYHHPEFDGFLKLRAAGSAIGMPRKGDDDHDGEWVH